MSTITDLIAAEDPKEVVLFLTRGEGGISYPRLDGLYNRNDWVNIRNNYELLRLVSDMRKQGLIIEAGGGFKRGPNWREPKFKGGKVYTFD
ncbi:hypothetical protein DV532_23045 [Pseudomonas sp. Leaf58]|uniref:hypothetical protein n=1 Tax=Pseudomonas TaxID=286 RepID=UPI0009E92D20|nr:hypothetical protein [Pseudomonas sp. Leaf58]AYG47013.1 hypothetical protein DV532_23045 [Pseudomonas sp. Leaf58]